jgi:hypothetical protein
MNREGRDTVERHPDSETLLAFREHRLSGGAVAEVAAHVGGCARCAKVEPLAGRTAFSALIDEDHLSDDELDLIVDQRVEDPSYSAVSRHAATCAMCRAEVADLRRFDAEREEEIEVERPSQRWWLAAAVAFTVLALSTIAVLLRPSTPGAPPSIATQTTAPVAPATVTAAPPAARVVASLTDGDGRIALLENGAIAGVELHSSRDAEDARAVLSGRSIAIPAFIAAMPGAIRGANEGGGANKHPLRVNAPFRSAVRDARPRFSWTPVRDARSYHVAVFDADYDEVARSEELQSTSWTPSTPLPSGVDLSWHVIATTDAGEISSAGSDRAEAVFRVLTPGEAAKVAAGEAQYRDTHLLRGLLYSRHGLLHDAQREFRLLGEQNPDSPIARALLESVSR